MRQFCFAAAAALTLAGCVRPVPVVPTPAPVIVRAPAPAAPARKDSASVQVAAVVAPRDTGTRAPASSPAARSSDSAGVSATDIARQVAQVFGDSASAPRAAANAGGAGDEPSWDMEVRAYETTERVDHWVHYFTGAARERITARLERGTRFEPMIRAKLREGGVPEDMYYLGLVESGYDPHAYSRVGAVGIWQFMSSTARDMGMRVDWWVDERRDPVRSTAAAVRFIRGLREQFGSLYLAAAAYNGGPGRVARGLSRFADDLEGTTGEDVFFVLADKDFLPRETRDYVPQLIAAALIAKEPKRYGMELHPRPPFAYDSARVPAATPLAAVARAAGASVADIQELNPHFIRGMTPPRDRVFVRIPLGATERFDSSFAALPAEDLVATHPVETRKGETMDGVARRAGISAGRLAEFNPNARRSRKTGRLIPGQTLLVPTAAVAAAAISVPDPSIERVPRAGRLQLHLVKSGETLSHIARRYHTTTKVLMRLNGLRRPLIFPGQSLVVGGSSSRAKAKAPVRIADARAATGRAGSRSTASVRQSGGARADEDGDDEEVRPAKASRSAKAAKHASTKAARKAARAKQSPPARKQPAATRSKKER